MDRANFFGIDIYQCKGERVVDIRNGNLHISIYTLQSENTSPFECRLWEENTIELKALGESYNTVNLE